MPPMPPMPPIPPMPPGGMPPPLIFLRLFGDHALGGQQQAGNGGRILQRVTGHLGRVDDAGLDQVLVLLGVGVEAVGALAGS